MVCRGPNDGVEHKELAEKVSDLLRQLGVRAKDVVGFVSDSASVLKAAYTHHLKDLFPNAPHILCAAHTLNGVGGAMIQALPDSVGKIFDLGPVCVCAIAC